MTTTATVYQPTRTYGDARRAAAQGLAESDLALKELLGELAAMDREAASLHGDKDLALREVLKLWKAQLTAATVAEGRRVAKLLGSRAISDKLDKYERDVANAETAHATAQRAIPHLQQQLDSALSEVAHSQGEIDALKRRIDACDATDAFMRLQATHESGEFQAVDPEPPSKWYWLTIVALAPFLLISVFYAIWDQARRKDQALALEEGTRIFGTHPQGLTGHFEAHLTDKANLSRLQNALRVPADLRRQLAEAKRHADLTADQIRTVKASLPTLIHAALDERFLGRNATFGFTRREVIGWPTKALRRAGLRVLLIDEQLTQLAKLRAPLEAEVKPIRAYQAKVKEVLGVWGKYSRRRRGPARSDSDRTDRNKDFAPWLLGCPAGFRARATRTTTRVRRAHTAFNRRGYDVSREVFIDRLLECVDITLDTLGPEAFVEAYGIAVDLTEQSIGVADRAFEAATDLGAQAMERFGQLVDMPVLFDQLEGIKGGDLKALGTFMPEAGGFAEASEVLEADSLAGHLPDDQGPDDGPDGPDGNDGPDADPGDVGADLGDGS